MVDMGQADRTLRARPGREQHHLAWTIALRRAANEMGLPHYADIPAEQVESLKGRARAMQAAIATHLSQRRIAG